jgi:rod shape-determining protein MreC
LIKPHLSSAICLILALYLFAGSSNNRLQKAQWLSHSLLLPFATSLHFYESIRTLKQDNHELRTNLANQKLQSLYLYNQLKMMQNTRSIRFELAGTPFTTAEVVGFSGQFHERNLIISKGRADGVELDSPVVSATGIIGKTIIVNNHNSVILPLTHSQFQLAVMDQSSNVQGILQSDLTGKTYMNLIKLGSQVSIGDTIVTSNLSRLFPKGYPVGKISKIKESQDNLFLSAQIEPYTLVENLEHVFILKKSYITKLFSPVVQNLGSVNPSGMDAKPLPDSTR